MPRYFVDIAYNGNNYSGYQVQNDHVTVQGTLDYALSVLLKKEIKTTGSSRTDAGVHALQNVCHFDWDADIDTEQLAYKLNRILPKDIVCNKIYEVAEDQHARFSAGSRKYIYKLHYSKDAFNEGQSFYFRYGNLDVEKMNQAAKFMFDFEEYDCFCKLHGDNKTTICHIQQAEWIEVKPNYLEFHIRANRFLRGMVRATVGTLILVGRGKITVDEFKDIIASKDMSRADFSPPGHGLYLVEVEY